MLPISIRLLVLLLLLSSPISATTNNADLVWYDEAGVPRNYQAKQEYPEGFNETKKIAVNQQLPLLWEVKFDFFDNLEELVIENCGVNEIEIGTFAELKPLINLSLAFNNIKVIREKVFNFVQIKNLDLGHNKIQAIAAKAFDHMSRLEKIILDYNELRRWSSDWFFNCSRLVTVSITHNFLDELPKNAFKNFWPSSKSNLTNFYFSYNKIETIDREVFENTGNFGALFLDWNDIPRVDGHTFGKLTSVEYLNLSGDSLKCLSEEFVTNVLNKAKLVSVLGNPLKCECLQELKKRDFTAKILHPVDCTNEVQ